MATISCRSVAFAGRLERPRIWNPALRLDVSSWLLSRGHAAEVRAARRPHPAGGAEEPLGREQVKTPRAVEFKPRYVYVDIRKPSRARA